MFSYDTRRHEKSERSASFTLDDDADDIAGLIASYGLHKPVVIGFSMGSYITLKAAEKYPDLFSKIVLIGTIGRGDMYKNEDTSSMMDIKKVNAPALVITGENDKTNPETICSLIDDFLTVKLTYSDHEPLGNMRTTFLNDVFFSAVERETRGRVKITPHWNVEICTGYDAVKAVRARSADLAVVVPEYDMKALPIHQLFKSFPTDPTGAEQVSFFRRVYDDVPALTRELEANNLHAVIIATGYPAAFFSAKPLTSLHDIKGQRWRSASFWHKDFLSNAGAIPGTMRWGRESLTLLMMGLLTASS